MALIWILLLLVLLVGGFGLFVEAIWWLLIIGVLLILVGFVLSRGGGRW